MEADVLIDSHRGFFNELEMGNRDNTIYVLHKAYLFLKYIPTTLSIDESSLSGLLYSYRIKNGFPLSSLQQKIGLDKSTISRFEKNKPIKSESLFKIEEFLKTIQ